MRYCGHVDFQKKGGRKKDERERESRDKESLKRLGASLVYAPSCAYISAGRQRFTRGDHFDPLEKRIFLFSIFLFSYRGLFFETIHEPLSLEEGTLAEDDSVLPCP